MPLLLPAVVRSLRMLFTSLRWSTAMGCVRTFPGRSSSGNLCSHDLCVAGAVRQDAAAALQAEAIPKQQRTANSPTSLASQKLGRQAIACRRVPEMYKELAFACGREPLPTCSVLQKGAYA